MMDAVGTTTYGYTAGGQLWTEDGPWSDDIVTNTYNHTDLSPDFQLRGTEWSLLGRRSSKGTLLRPDFQIPVGRGKLGVIDLTTPGQAAKISKYADPNTPYLFNVLYSP